MTDDELIKLLMHYLAPQGPERYEVSLGLEDRIFEAEPVQLTTTLIDLIRKLPLPHLESEEVVVSAAVFIGQLLQHDDVFDIVVAAVDDDTLRETALRALSVGVVPRILPFVVELVQSGRYLQWRNVELVQLVSTLGASTTDQARDAIAALKSSGRWTPECEAELVAVTPTSEPPSL